jgi:3-dehydroquinate dehydratase-2
MKIIVINGPNINMLGKREPAVYGSVSYDRLVDMIGEWADSLEVSVRVFQSNSEGGVIDAIQGAADCDGIVINAGGYTHTSVAIRDALLSVKLPVVEVHLSNVFSREGFRKSSFISDIAVGVITGFGTDSYRLGLIALCEHLKKKKHAENKN